MDRLGKAWLDPSVLAEAMREMCIQDAGSAFLLELVLIRIGQD